MLRFAVFKDDAPATEFPLRHAYLIGKDDLGVPGSVSFRDGIITCDKATGDEASLALQIDAGDCGVLTLRTCLLPNRQHPYLLDLELARHRIMLFLNKLEEWSLSDLPTSDPVMATFEEARAAFTEALVAREPNTDFTPHQAQAARLALRKAIHASEKLARLSAERLLANRLEPPEDTKPIAPPRLGVIVPCEQFAEPLRKIVAGTFDFMISAMRWNQIEREEGRFSFVDTDRWIEWAVRQGRVPVIAGPILDFSPQAVPEWMGVWGQDYQSVREFAYEHAKRVVTRYRRTVNRWIAVSGINLNRGFSLSVDQMIELTRLGILIVRKLHPSAKVVVEVTEPWGEHVSANPESLSPLLYAELILESGMQIDALGLRIQLADHAPGRSMRDLCQLSALLDDYAAFERPIDITAIGVPSETPTPIKNPDNHEDEPGWWHSRWSPEQQAEWMTEALTIIASKPFIRSVAWQSLYDATGSAPCALITSEGRAKPALRRFAEIRDAIRQKKVPTLALGAVAGTHTDIASAAQGTPIPPA